MTSCLMRIFTRKKKSFDGINGSSRHFTKISEDINDFEVLIPGHFLIGCSLNCKLEQKTEVIQNHCEKKDGN